MADKKIYKIVYDKGKCIGAANCVQVAPDTWELDKDGLAKAKKVTFTDEELDKQLKAAKSCPTHAISIVGPDGKKIV